MADKGTDKAVWMIGGAMYLAVNSLFVWKYAMRLCPYPWAATLGYWILLAGAGLAAWHLIRNTARPKAWLWGIGIAGLGIGIALQYAIDPYSLNVDRWSAIHNWLATLLHGDYPYSAPTHLGGYGSPFPVWQLLHLPFYGLGNVGLGTLAVCIVWIAVCVRTQSYRAALGCLAALVLCPAFWYEVSVRSDLLANMIFVVTLCQWLIYKQIRLSEHIVAVGVIAGLVAATRLVAVVPLAVMYGNAFLQLDGRRKIAFIGTAAGTFALIFLPFAVWHGSTLLWFEYSPFVLQTRQGSPVIFLIWAAIAIGWVVHFKPEGERMFLSTAVLLFILVAFACGKQVWSSSLGAAINDSGFDITYFSMALPFLISALFCKRKPLF